MPDGFYIGPLKIYFYGIIIMLGVLAAVQVAVKEAKRRELDSEIVWDMIPWLLILGIIGARLWHVFTPSKSMGVGPEYYFTHPIEILNTRQGGLGIPGGVIGGVIALIIYTRKKKLSFLTWADIIAPGLALAQAIGRWGNFLTRNYMVRLQRSHGRSLSTRLTACPVTRNSKPFIPCSCMNPCGVFLISFLLLFLGRTFEQKLKPGDIFWVYLIVYPVGRFLLEFIRLDPSFIGGINANQITMAVVAVFGALMLILNHVRKEKPAEDEEKPIPS